MKTSSLKAVSKFLVGAMSVYALVISVFWVAITDIMFISDYEGVTGEPLADALAAGDKSAALWLQTKRLVGVELLATSVFMIFVVYKAFNKGEKWAWVALLIGGFITWGSLLGYKAVIGYFRFHPSSLTFVIGALLYLVGIVLSATWMLSESGE